MVKTVFTFKNKKMPLIRIAKLTGVKYPLLYKATRQIRGKHEVFAVDNIICNLEASTKKYKYNGVLFTPKELAKFLGLSLSYTYALLKPFCYGDEVNKIFLGKKREGQIYKICGGDFSIKGISIMLSLKESTVRKKIVRSNLPSLSDVSPLFIWITKPVSGVQHCGLKIGKSYLYQHSGEILTANEISNKYKINRSDISPKTFTAI